MKESKTYTAEQLKGTERAIKILMSMPEENRDMAAMLASAFVEGMTAEKKVRDREEKSDSNMSLGERKDYEKQ